MDISRVHVVYMCVSYFEARLLSMRCVYSTFVFSTGRRRLARRTEQIIYRACARVSEFYAVNWAGRSEFMKFVRAARVYLSDRQTTRLFARIAFFIAN